MRKPNASDPLSARVRRATESILQSESLTTDLQDAEAAALLEWGLACAEACARATAGLPEGQAQKRIERGLSAVRKIMRRVNAIVSEGRDMEEGELTALFAAILEFAPDLPPTPTQGRRSARGRSGRTAVHVSRLVAEVPELPPDEVLKKILALLRSAQEAR